MYYSKKRGRNKNLLKDERTFVNDGIIIHERQMILPIKIRDFEFNHNSLCLNDRQSC